MTYPIIRPTGRSFAGGDYPTKTFRTNNGKNTRILYGNQRVGRTIELTYENVTDAQAYQFMQDYDEQLGTFEEIPLNEDQRDAIFSGWSAEELQIIGGDAMQWRYAESPQITSVRPGRSTVVVKLVGEV